MDKLKTLLKVHGVLLINPLLLRWCDVIEFKLIEANILLSQQVLKIVSNILAGFEVNI